MEYKEFSIADLAVESRRLAEKVPEDRQPDLVVFIARGGLLIGQAMAAYFGCPLRAVKAVREGNAVKELVAPLLAHLPKSCLRWLRARELKSGVHQSHMERQVAFLEAMPLQAERILVVDDSVDTGASMKQVCAALAERYPLAVIETAALNVLTPSMATLRTQYALYYDQMVNTPASVDSADHAAFLRLWTRYAGHMSTGGGQPRNLAAYAMPSACLYREIPDTDAVGRLVAA